MRVLKLRLKRSVNPTKQEMETFHKILSGVYYQLTRDGKFEYTNGKALYGRDMGLGFNPKNGNLIIDETKFKMGV